jgi:hypothetical protein
MDMVGTNMCGVEHPFAVLAVLANRCEHNGPLVSVQSCGDSTAKLPLELNPNRIRFDYRRLWNVVESVDGALGVAMQSCAITGEGDEVRDRAGSGPKSRFVIKQVRRAV